MKLPPVIVLVGTKGSGKTTICEHLTDKYSYRRISQADPLKRMLMTLGLTNAEVYGEFKERPCELLLGKTPRHAMQTLGTEWGRQCIGQDFWLVIWKGMVKLEVSRGHRVVCDDVRFMNEAVAARALGGSIWRVMRPRVEHIDIHASEQELSRIPFDLRFGNDSTISALHRLVDKVLV